MARLAGGETAPAWEPETQLADTRSAEHTLRRLAMDGHRPLFLALALLIGALCGSTGIAGLAPAHADEVTDWNIVGIDVLALGGQNPVVMTRGLAIAHL